MQSGLGEREYLDRFHAECEKVRTYHREKNKTYRANKPEHYRKLLRESYHRHKIKRAQEARQNREERKKDPIKLAKYRVWCRNNVKKRKAADPNYRIKFLMRNRIWMALQRGVAKAGPTVELLGCTIPEFKIHIESLWLPGMTWDNYGKLVWHIDHIKPCKSFDLTDPEQQRICFHYTNTRPLWAKDNLSKGAELLNNVILPAKRFQRNQQLQLL